MLWLFQLVMVMKVVWREVGVMVTALSLEDDLVIHD